MGDVDGLGYRGTAVVVTRGSTGMGEAMACIFGDPSAKVHLVDTQQSKSACEPFYKAGRERRIRINTTAPYPTRTAFIETSVEVPGQEFLDNFPYPVLHPMAMTEVQAWPMVLLNSRRNVAVTGANAAAAMSDGNRKNA